TGSNARSAQRPKWPPAVVSTPRASPRARAERPCSPGTGRPSETLAAMAPLLCGIDVSPLALTRAGTARYVVHLLAALNKLADVAVRPFRFDGEPRLAKVIRDAVWYPAVLPLAARRADVDVLHCTTIRAPLSARVPVVVTVHDVA